LSVDAIPKKSLSDRALLEILALSEDATAIYTSPELVIEMANDAMIAFWHRDRSVIGMRLEDAVPELLEQEFIGLLKEVWRTGVTYAAKERPAQLLSGGELETAYFNFVYRAIKNPDGSTFCILHSATDMTEQVLSKELLKEKKEEVETLNSSLAQQVEDMSEVQNTLNELYEQVAENEMLFKNIFDQAPLGFALLSGPDQVIQLVNDRILKIWDRSREEVLGKTHMDARPEMVGQPMNDWMRSVFKTGKTRTNSEIRVSLKSGNGLREAYVNSVYSPIINTKGTITGILIIIDEVTDRIVARQEIERSQEQLRLAIESAKLGTWRIDRDNGRFTASNRTKELFGFAIDEDMPFEAALAQIAPDHRQNVQRHINLAIAEGSHYDFEYPIQGRYDDKLRWVRATGKVYPGQLGKSDQFVGTIQDISDRKKDEQLRNDFIVMVSHELKTPLTSLSGYLQVLERKAIKLADPLSVNTLKKTNNLVAKMKAMITGFLDVSRMEAGKIRIDRMRFNMADLVREVEESLEEEDGSHDIFFHPVEETWLDADRDKIEQVVNNFISNAIKYAPANTRIEVACTEQDGQIQVSVKDQGIGIQPADIDKMFDRFYRVENPQTRNVAGFGIGLYICKEIIDRHEGRIWVESEPGQGSTFYFSLPAR
jgi:PAS domain S-box-containing protein